LNDWNRTAAKSILHTYTHTHTHTHTSALTPGAFAQTARLFPGHGLDGVSGMADEVDAASAEKPESLEQWPSHVSIRVMHHSVAVVVHWHHWPRVSSRVSIRVMYHSDSQRVSIRVVYHSSCVSIRVMNHSSRVTGSIRVMHHSSRVSIRVITTRSGVACQYPSRAPPCLGLAGHTSVSDSESCATRRTSVSESCTTRRMFKLVSESCKPNSGLVAKETSSPGRLGRASAAGRDIH
jgi:hypothetical protein